MLDYVELWSHARQAVVLTRIVRMWESRGSLATMLLDNGEVIETSEHYPTLVARFNHLQKERREDHG